MEMLKEGWEIRSGLIYSRHHNLNPLSIILKSITTIVTGTLTDVILVVLIVVGWKKLR